MKITVKHNIPKLNVAVNVTDGDRLTYKGRHVAPKSVYLDRTPVNVTINKLDDENLGWGTFNNTVHTKQEPFSFQAGVPFVFPLRNDNGIIDQAPEEIKKLISNNSNKINGFNFDDIFIMRLEFTMSTELSSQDVSLHFDIGGNIAPFNFEKFVTDSDTVNPKPTTLLLMFFQRNTFIANGAQIICTVQDDGDLWDIIGTPLKLGHGKTSL